MKALVAGAAADLVQDGMTVGLGSGSTAAFVVEDIGRRYASGRLQGITGVPTSFQSIVLARKYGIPMASLNDVDSIDLALDGADEVDPDLTLIKGGGACHTREKLVDSRARTFVVVVDESKIVDRIGSTRPVPVEVLPDAYRQVEVALESLGGQPELRMAVRKAGPVVTDQGNLVLDVRFSAIPDPGALEREINNIPGVLENGLFVSLADEVLVAGQVGGSRGVRTMRRTRS